jgi:hypothetical protein
MPHAAGCAIQAAGGAAQLPLGYQTALAAALALMLSDASAGLELRGCGRRHPKITATASPSWRKMPFVEEDLSACQHLKPPRFGSQVMLLPQLISVYYQIRLL